uniref:DUF5610 domain-containing protein n=1 Tax=Hydrogenovibrio crunogenus (strain DSM 25203 / XCL-2) TaxID=317025 RepID=Q31HQ3_HYDCU
MPISNIPPGLMAYQKLAGHDNRNEQAQSANKSEQHPGQGQIKADQMTIRNERQASLVAHLFGDSSKAIENSLKMTFQAAIEKLNETLTPDLGENAISQEALKKQGGMEYWTPENTAGRIVSGATAFLPAFQKAHPELEGEALMQEFMSVVGGGLQSGFDEAKGILGDLNVFEGKVKDTFSATTDLVSKGMENFRREFLGLPPLEEAEATDSSEEEQAPSEPNT